MCKVSMQGLLFATLFVVIFGVTGSKAAESDALKSCLDARKQIECLDKKVLALGRKVKRLVELQEIVDELQKRIDEEIGQKISNIESKLGKTAKFQDNIQLKAGPGAAYCLMVGGMSTGSQRGEVWLGDCGIDDNRNYWNLRKR